MGTRHLILVYYKGAYHIAQYGQWDGYPSGQGAVVLAFARDPTNVTKLKAVIDGGLLYEMTGDQIRDCTDEAETLQEDWQERVSQNAMMGNHTDEEFRSPLALVCPTLSRDTGAKILELAAKAEGRFPVVRSGLSSWLEWVYVVDLDEGVLEVWTAGFGGSGMKSGRFADVEEWLGDDETAVVLVGKWALDGLPSKEEFARKCDDPYSEE